MPIINQVVQGGGSSVSEPYLKLSVGSSGKLSHSTTINHIVDLTTATDLSDYILYKAYSGNTAISGTVDLSGLTTISGTHCIESCFEGCPNITVVDMSNVVTISGRNACDYAFKGSGVTQVLVSKLTTVGSYGLYATFHTCLGLSGTIDFSKVNSIGGNGMENVLSGCSNVTGVNINNLTTLGGRGFQTAFYGTGVSSIAFPSLTTTSGGYCFNSFVGNAAIASLWFYVYSSGSNNDFGNMLNNASNVVVHFPMNMQTTMSSWSNVASGFSGTNTTVLFDIVTSLTGADTNTYTRSEKDSTETATAWKYNDVLYYTSGVSNHTAGVNEPTVGGTIYSDDTCTTAVTTISAIA